MFRSSILPNVTKHFTVHSYTICDTTKIVMVEKVISDDSNCASGILDFIRQWMDHMSKKRDEIKLSLDVGFLQ